MGRPLGSTNKGKAKPTSAKMAKVTEKKEKKPSVEKKEKIEKKAAKEKNVFLDMMNIAGNEYSDVAVNGIEAGDIKGFMDTGSLSLNGLVSGQLEGGGFPNNKIVVLAGEEATGKTFFVLECIKRFLDTNPTGGIYFFETESAISKSMLLERNIDVRRIFWMPVSTVQELRTQSVKILDKYLTYDEAKRPPMMFVLDSLGMISTSKEIEDTAAGKETADMTRARLIKSTFRVLTLKLGRAGVPFLVTNHTYDGQGMFATKEMCLAEGTMIKLVSGECRPIEQIKENDVVETLAGFEKVKEKYIFDSEDAYEIELEDGTKIVTTGQHKFLNESLEWQCVEEFIPGDVLMVKKD